MSNYKTVGGRLRHYRYRYPNAVDVRQTTNIQVVDRFFYTDRPEYVVDMATGTTNEELTWRCVVRTGSGLRPPDCARPEVDYGDRLEDEDTGLFYTPSPSGYEVASYPILRYNTDGFLAALFEERVVVETRNVCNSPIALNPSTCDLPNVVIQETYTFSAPSAKQQLRGTVTLNDAAFVNDKFYDALPGVTNGFRYSPQYIMNLDLEVATGGWQDATSVWVRHFSPRFGESIPNPDLDQFREVVVFRGVRA